MNESAHFSILLLDRDDRDPMELARALAEFRRTPVQDQVLASKRAWGIVAEDVSESEAKALGEALRRAGMKCAVGPTAALAELAPVEVAHTIDALPSADPVLVSAAGLMVTTTTTKTVKEGPSSGQRAASAAIMMTTGLPIKIGSKKRKVAKTQTEESLSFHANLCYEGPSRRLRIDASHFDFSYLKERMLYQAQANLKVLVGDLVQASPEAWTNHGARVLLEGRPVRTMGYASLDDLERETRWLLTLRALGS